MVEEDWWPCDKRVAHGPHPITDTVPLSNDQLTEALLRGPGGELNCPGVKAHPNTMIGREASPRKKEA